MIVSNATFATNGQPANILCHGICGGDPDTVVQRLNTALPTFLHISLPEPDSPYGDITTAGGIETIPGSPGS